MESKPFLFGVSNSAFQVEGTPFQSDWSNWVSQPGRVADGTTADSATDFFNRYEEDFKLARLMGASAFRMSIAWERVEPVKGHWNESALDVYRKMILSMREQGLEPIVTLHHFVLPEWLSHEGGLLAYDFVNYFTRYAEKVVVALSGLPLQVTHWITFNEAVVLSSFGYLEGRWPPGVKGSRWLTFRALQQISQAHNQTVQILKRKIPVDLKFSTAHSWRVCQPLTGNFWNKLAARFVDYFYNRWFLNSVKKNLDFLAVNYYGRAFVEAQKKWPFYKLRYGGDVHSDLGWEIYPQGLYHALKEAGSFKLPILVTENGLADKDDRLRTEFLRQHLEALMEAKEEGVPVFGYLYWSLTDNFEWNLGLSPRFGLVEIDYKTLERKPRPSFYAYKEMITSYGEQLFP
jgi:beta-glucosidase